MSYRFLTPTLVFLIGAPFCIFAHECGHYLSATLYGCDARLYAAKTTYTGTFVDRPTADSANLMIAIAGPAVQIASLLLGAIVVLVFVRRGTPRRDPGIVFWVASLGCFSGLRWFGIVRGATTDESSISEALGYEWYAVPAVMVFVSISASVFLYCTHAKMHTLRPLGAAIIAGSAGAYAWIHAVGPALLGG